MSDRKLLTRCLASAIVARVVAEFQREQYDTTNVDLMKHYAEIYVADAAHEALAKFANVTLVRAALNAPALTEVQRQCDEMLAAFARDEQKRRAE